MNKLLLLFAVLLLTSCDGKLKTYKVEFNSGKIYRIKSTGYYLGSYTVNFWGDRGMFPRDSVKSITVENYE